MRCSLTSCHCAFLEATWAANDIQQTVDQKWSYQSIEELTFYLILFWLIAALQLTAIKKIVQLPFEDGRPCTQVFPLVSGISQTRTLSIRGVTFQEECRFTTHVGHKLIKINQYLFILRSLRKEISYTLSELDHLFQRFYPSFDLRWG